MVTTHEPQYRSFETTMMLASRILDQLGRWQLTAPQPSGVLALVYLSIKAGE